MDREAWCAAVHGVTKSWTWLSDWTQRCICVYTCICVCVYIYDVYVYIQHTHIYVVPLNKCILNSLFYTLLFVFNDTSWRSSCIRLYQFSHSVMSDFPIHARLPYPSPTLGACPDSCPSSRWWHPTILSSVIPFSSCLQSCPASESFPMSQFFASDGQSIESFSFSISPSNEYSGLISFRIDLFDLLAVQGTLKSLLQQHSSKASILRCSGFFIIQLSHSYMTTGKTIALTRWIFVGKVMTLLFNMLSRLVITFCPRNKHLLISWPQSPSAVILEPPK